MDNTLEIWRGSIRAMSAVLGYPSGFRTPETEFYRRALAGERKIGTVGVDLRAFIILAIWRTLFRPTGMTLVVTATESQGQWFIDECEKRIVRNELSRNRVWIGRDKVGLCEAQSRIMSTIHIRPNELVKQDPVGDVMILVPNLDSIDGAYLRLASDFVALPGVSLVANTPRQRPAC
jgi:hypothetical protein